MPIVVSVESIPVLRKAIDRAYAIGFIEGYIKTRRRTSGIVWDAAALDEVVADLRMTLSSPRHVSRCGLGELAYEEISEEIKRAALSFGRDALPIEHKSPGGVQDDS